MVLRDEHRDPVEQEDQEGKLYSSLSSDQSNFVGFCVAYCYTKKRTF